MIFVCCRVATKFALLLLNNPIIMIIIIGFCMLVAISCDEFLKCFGFPNIYWHSLILVRHFSVMYYLQPILAESISYNKYIVAAHTSMQHPLHSLYTHMDRYYSLQIICFLAFSFNHSSFSLAPPSHYISSLLCKQLAFSDQMNRHEKLLSLIFCRWIYSTVRMMERKFKPCYRMNAV